jgi:hypothetical protein
MRGAVALTMGALLGAIVSAPSPARACDVCQLKLTHRTGPYRIVIAKEGARLARHAPQISVTIVNPGSPPLVLGDAPSSRIMLNSVAPNARVRMPIITAPRGRTRTVAARSRVTFYARYPVRLDRPGVYRLNVSYGPVDSNILTYTVK